MTEIFRGYIQTKNKKCIQKFGHGEPLLTWPEAMPLILRFQIPVKSLGYAGIGLEFFFG